MSSERTLQLILRVMGSSSLLALLFIGVPHSWMESIHLSLGMGPLPDAPVVGYLARSTSAFYAMAGGLFWVVSFDVERHRRVLIFLGGAITALGVVLLVVDWAEGLPFWWAIWEGPFVVAFGVVLSWLSRRIGPPQSARSEVSWLRAATFAADKHRDQRRKDAGASPYINHPLSVAHVLAHEGGVQDASLLVAALLHDTVEDTETTPDELEAAFGPTVRGIVDEVTDEKSLPKNRRKALQVEHAPDSSPAAKQLKIADKVCNIRDIVNCPPADWSEARKAEYLAWTEQVVQGCRGVNPALDAVYDRAIEEARIRLGIRS